MENILVDILRVCAYLDDVLVSGTSFSDHLRNLQVVLERMLMKGIHLSKEKCKLLEEELVYLGYVINSQGISPSPE